MKKQIKIVKIIKNSCGNGGGCFIKNRVLPIC